MKTITLTLEQLKTAVYALENSSIKEALVVNDKNEAVIIVKSKEE